MLPETQMVAFAVNETQCILDSSPVQPRNHSCGKMFRRPVIGHKEPESAMDWWVLK